MIKKITLYPEVLTKKHILVDSVHILHGGCKLYPVYYSHTRLRTDGVLVLNQWWPFCIFMSQPESDSFVTFFLIWLKTNGVPSFHFEESQFVPFDLLVPADSIRLFAPLENVVPFSRHSNELPLSCCNSPWGPFPYSVILNPFPNGPKGSKKVTCQGTFLDILTCLRFLVRLWFQYLFLARFTFFLRLEGSTGSRVVTWWLMIDEKVQ